MGPAPAHRGRRAGAGRWAGPAAPQHPGGSARWARRLRRPFRCCGAAGGLGAAGPGGTAPAPAAAGPPAGGQEAPGPLRGGAVQPRGLCVICRGAAALRVPAQRPGGTASSAPGALGPRVGPGGCFAGPRRPGRPACPGTRFPGPGRGGWSPARWEEDVGTARGEPRNKGARRSCLVLRTRSSRGGVAGAPRPPAALPAPRAPLPGRCPGLVPRGASGRPRARPQPAVPPLPPPAAGPLTEQSCSTLPRVRRVPGRALQQVSFHQPAEQPACSSPDPLPCPS